VERESEWGKVSASPAGFHRETIANYRKLAKHQAVYGASALTCPLESSSWPGSPELRQMYFSVHFTRGGLSSALGPDVTTTDVPGSSQLSMFLGKEYR
jgi:hypothetical protein